MAAFDELVGSFEALWTWMARAPGARRHPLRAPTCITVGQDGPRGRTMILREVLDTDLVFFTDARSAKVAHICARSSGAVHAYDGKRRLQVQLSGTFTILKDHPKLQTWRAQGLQRFADYGQTVAPGSPLDMCQEPPRKDLAREHFTVVTFEPHAIELLKLSRDGHRRAVWRRSGDDWTLTPLIP